MENNMLLSIAIFAGMSFAEETPSEVTVEQVLQEVDDLFRREHSIVTMQMRVKTKRYERTMTMEATSLGTEHTLIKILEPAKDAGTCTLKVDQSIWNYLPRVDRTMKIPAGMMGGAWMGSHLSNDDLVKENRFSQDFSAQFLSKPGLNNGDEYVIELVPKEDTAIVWGKIVSRSTAALLPIEVKYYDEDGTLKRTDSFSEIKEMDGVKIPSVFTITPAEKPGELTEITYIKADFTTPVSKDQFSLQALKK